MVRKITSTKKEKNTKKQKNTTCNRNQTESATKEPVESHLKLMEACPDLIAIMQDDRIRWANSQFLAIFGYTSQDIDKGIDVVKIISRKDRKAFVQRYVDLASEKIPPKAFLADAVTKYGTCIHCEISDTPVTYRGKDAFILFIRNITNRVEEEKSLRESKERFSKLSDAAFEGIFIHEDGIILEANKAGAEMLGYDISEIKGRNMLEFCAPESRERLIKNASSRYDKPYEITGLKKDGTKINARIRAKNITYMGREVRVAAIENIDKRKRAEKMLQIHRDLGIALTSARSKKDVLDLILESALQISEIDCGCIYTIEKSTGELILESHRNIPKEIIELSSRYSADSPHAILIKEGKPVYGNYSDMAPAKDSIRMKEGFRATAFVPIQDATGTIAAINLGSHTVDSFTKSTRDFIEVIASRTGTVIARISTETELKKSEKYNRQLIETMNDALGVLDKNGILTYANPKMCEKLGYTQDDILGRNVMELLDNKNQEILATQLSKRKKGKNDPYELEWIKKDGSIMPSIMAPQCLHDNKGNFTGSFAVITDISDLKKTEQALKESEEKYRIIADNVHDVIWVIGLDLRFTYLSPSIKKILGFTPGELMGLRFADILRPLSYEIAMRALNRELQRESDRNADPSRSVMIELEQRHKDGHSIWTELTASFLRDDTGALIGIIGVTRDISERKHSEEKLKQLQSALEVRVNDRTSELLESNRQLRQEVEKRRETEDELRTSKQRLQGILDNMSDGVTITDMNGFIVDANTSTCRQFGYTKDEIVGKTPGEIFIDETDVPNFPRHVASMLSGQSVIDAPYLAKRKDETRFHVSVSLSAINDSDGNPEAIIAVHRDLTERKKSDDAIRLSEEKFRTIFENANDGIIFADAEATLLDLNKKCADILGYEREELIGKNFTEFSFLGKDNLDKISEALERISSGETPPLIEFNALRKNGTPVIIEINPKIIRKEGKITGFICIIRDVTERKQSEMLLRENEEKFKTIFENANDEIVYLKEDGTVIDVNNMVEGIFGYKREEVVGRNFTDFNHLTPESLQESVEMFMEVMAGRPAEMRVVEATHKDGRRVFAEVNTTVIHKTDGTRNILSIIRDVTDRIKSDEALRKSEEQYRLVANNITDVIWVMDLNTFRFSYFSPSVESLGGYTVTEAMAIDAQGFLTPDSFKHMMEVLDEELHNETINADILRTRTLDFEAIRKNGSTVWLESTMKFIRDENGTPINVLGVSRDISKRKQAENALRKSEEKYRLLAENITDVIWVRDMNLNMTYISPSIKNTRGFSPDEFMKLPLNKIMPPESYEKVVTLFKKELEAENAGTADPHRVVTFEIEQFHKNGSTLWSEIKTSFIRDTVGKAIGMLGVTRDITERKKTREELKKAKKEAESSSRAKSYFLANMSHEIRTPMNGIIGMANLMLQTRLDNEQREFAEMIKTSADSLLSLINDILDFSKIEAGHMKLETIDFNLRVIMEEVADLMSVKADSKGLKFSCLVHKDVPAILRGDPSRLKQILINLAGNAVKFTKKGEVFVETSIRDVSETDIMLFFTIKDTGIGISENRINQLFESFSQVDESMARKYGGTGLGLAISKQLVELMDGTIGFDSREGEGSTFWFTAVFQKKRDIKDELFIPADLKGKNILIVDDSQANRQVISEHLKLWECCYDEATDSQDAFQKLTQAAETNSPYDAVIIDMQMPDMESQNLGEKIKSSQNLKKTAMVMMISIGQQGDAALMKETGYASLLTLPVKRAKLFECLTTALGKKLKKPEEKMVSVHIPRFPLKNETNQRYRILLVEDNKVNQKFAMRLLDKMDFDVDAVGSGMDAIATLEKEMYDLVLMDVQMPDMDGFEATGIIRNPESRVLDHNIPIIAMTAHALKGDRERCLQAGMDDYAPKPVKAHDLAKVISKQLSIPFIED